MSLCKLIVDGYLLVHHVRLKPQRHDHKSLFIYLFGSPLATNKVATTLSGVHTSKHHNHSYIHLFSSDLSHHKAKWEDHQWQNPHTHTFIYTQRLSPHPTHIPHLTLSGGVWKTAPHKPAGHVDYHFNGLARWKCWFFGAEIIYCSYQSRTAWTKGKGAEKKRK